MICELYLNIIFLNDNWKSNLQNTIMKEYHLNVHIAILYMAKTIKY